MSPESVEPELAKPETAEPEALSAGAERFLGGKVIARQPAVGYRAAVDTVLLGAAAGLRPGDRALDLGCGAGTASLIAAWHAPAARLLGVERDAGLVALAQANVAANGFGDRITIEPGDVAVLGAGFSDAFDVVICNPPFLDDDHPGRRPAEPSRAAAFVAQGPGLARWIETGLKALKTGGRFVLIQRADRLDDVLAAFRPRAGDLALRPIAPKAEAAAKRILVRARKGAKGAPILLPPLILHGADGAFTPEAAALMDGRARLGFEGRALEPLERTG